MPLIGLPPYSSELNSAERVFEEVQREIAGKVYANLEDKLMAVQALLTDLESAKAGTFPHLVGLD
jgi:transposase